MIGCAVANWRDSLSECTYRSGFGSNAASTVRRPNETKGEAQAAAYKAVKSFGVKQIVWSAWAALTIAAIAYIIRFGSNVPYWDD